VFYVILILKKHHNTSFSSVDLQKQCWEFINLHMPLNADFPDIINVMRDNLQTQFFMSAIILLCWAIWSARNDLIFKGVQPSLPACKATFLGALQLLNNRVNSRRAQAFEQWSLSLV
jgi:hypothetical protein